MSHTGEGAPRIALVVDNPYRDLPGLVLVAWELCQRGATCLLVPMNLLGSEIWPLVPDFVLLNYLRTVNEGIARELMAAGIRVGVLETEGGIYNSDLGASHLARSQPQDAQTRNQISCYCAWSPSWAKYVVHSGWYRPEQVTVTGTPRGDFYALSWRRVALGASPYANDYSAPMVLINSSFPLANPQFQSPEQELEMMISRLCYDRNYVEQWQRTQVEAMRGMAALANHLARCFPDASFVFRPHPFEGEDIYRELLEPLPNLYLLRMGTVEGWLLRAKALISLTSSTAVDASAAGVPTLSPDWLPVHQRVPIVDAVAVGCSTLETLTDRVAAIVDGRFFVPAEERARMQQVIEDGFYKVDGRAHQRVADAIFAVMDSARKQTSVRRCAAHAYGQHNGKRSVGRTGRVALRMIFGLPVHWSFRRWCPEPPDVSWWDISEKQFDVDQVSALVQAIHSCAQNGSEELLFQVDVQSAQRRDYYHFGYLQGRSVAVFPRPD